MVQIDTYHIVWLSHKRASAGSLQAVASEDARFCSPASRTTSEWHMRASTDLCVEKSALANTAFGVCARTRSINRSLWKFSTQDSERIWRQIVK
jgi:hypothetical protein